MERQDDLHDRLHSYLIEFSAIIFKHLETLRKDVAAEFAVKSHTPDNPPESSDDIDDVDDDDDDDGRPSCRHPIAPLNRGNLSVGNRCKLQLLLSYAVPNTSGRNLLLSPYSLYHTTITAVAVHPAWIRVGEG